MKTIVSTTLSLLMTGAAMAHPGHGEGFGHESLTHPPVAPEFAVGLAVIALAVIVGLVRARK